MDAFSGVEALSLEGAVPLVGAFSGVEAFGEEERACPAGEAFTEAAGELLETDFVPAGVATETLSLPSRSL